MQDSGGFLSAHKHIPVQSVVPQAWLSGSEPSAVAVAAAGAEDAVDRRKRKMFEFIFVYLTLSFVHSHCTILHTSNIWRSYEMQASLNIGNKIKGAWNVCYSCACSTETGYNSVNISFNYTRFSGTVWGSDRNSVVHKMHRLTSEAQCNTAVFINQGCKHAW